ncbi:MAG: hypothetical protein ACYS1A_11155, partial [Planctomycetota bacterium]
AAAPIVPRNCLLEQPLSASPIFAPFKTSLVKTQDKYCKKINLIAAKIPAIFKQTPLALFTIPAIIGPK